MQAGSVKIIPGDIFQYTEGLLVIPRSTNGSISGSFEDGVSKLKIDYVPELSPLGNVAFYEGPVSRYKRLHIAFATSVYNNTSDYTAIACASELLKEELKSRGIENVYCPLLGTGAGGLDPVFSYVYLVLPFLSETINCNFHVIVYDTTFLSRLTELPHNRYELVRLIIQEAYRSISQNASIDDVITSERFFFEIARKRLNELNESKWPINKKKLLEDFLKFDGNFQQFIDTYSKPEPVTYLKLIGELITYLDTKAYNRHEWNKYPDKRAIARAGVRQNDWVKNIMIYLIEKDTNSLPNNIKNALLYISSPSEELPILSERDRKNIVSALSPEGGLSTTTAIRQYFEKIEGPRPENPLNWGAVIARILYSPLVKLLWDPDSRKIKVRKSRVTESRDANVDTPDPDESDNETPSTNQGREIPHSNGNNTQKGKSYKARLHDDRYAETDMLNYELYAQTIVNFITHRDTQAPLTIGIYAPWGMGKTTLMRFIQNKLNNIQLQGGVRIAAEIQHVVLSKINTAIAWLNKSMHLKIREFAVPEKPCLTVSKIAEELKEPPFSKTGEKNYQYPTVWFNAWKYDNTEQILSGLAYEVINQLVDKLPNGLERERFYFNLNRRRFDVQRLLNCIRSKAYQAIFNKLSLLFIAVSAGLVGIAYYIFITKGLTSLPTLYTGGFLTAAGIVNSVLQYMNERVKPASTYLNQFISQPKYEEKLGYFNEVEQDLKIVFDSLVDQNNPCVIFIDDLDRCSSKKVVEVIEAINLFINGDFPNCYFIIGMDAQMVAASIEACYSDVDRRLSGLQRTHGSLGWYFMEKFVQLQFVIPNISADSGRLFLKKLLQDTSEPENHNDVNIAELKQEAKSVDLTDKKSVSELTQKLDNIGLAHKDRVTEIKAELIDRAAKELNDTEDEVTQFLENYSHYLNVSPRVMKRFANLFRFYRFMQIPNLTSRLKELQDHEIAEMVIISLRWPQLPRLIQWNTAAELINGENALRRAEFLNARIIGGWPDQQPGEAYQWLLDENLKTFISDKKIDLKKYVEVGVW